MKLHDLTGGCVVLRGKKIQDTMKDYTWRTDPLLASVDAVKPLRMPFSQYLDIQEDQLKSPPRNTQRFAVCTLDDYHIGNIMCYDIDYIHREAEIGIMIGDTSYWGHGYGFSAMVIMVEYIFSKIPLKKLYLHTLEWNARARKCFQRCGFNYVGVVNRDGMKFVRMELLKLDWKEIRDEKFTDLESVKHHASLQID